MTIYHATACMLTLSLAIGLYYLGRVVWDLR